MSARLIAFMTLMTTSVSLAGPATLPVTPKEIVSETFHGIAYDDPYRWLEGDDGGNVTPRVGEWTDAQNALTRATLENIAGRTSVEERMRKLLTVGSISSPTMRGNRYFFSKRDGAESQSSIYMREGAKGESALLLDPAKIDKSGLTTIAFYSPSVDGKLLAFGTYAVGDENTTAYVLDIDRGVWLADEVKGKVGSVDWVPDGSGFLYRRLADVKNPYSGQVCYHVLGTHSRQDQILFEQYKEGPLATTWGPSAGLSEDGRWLVLSYWTSTSSNDLWIVDFDLWRRTGEFKQVEIAKGLPASFGGAIVGDTMYLQTTLDAPNGKIVMVDLHRPAKAHWKPVIAERKDFVIDSLQLARGILLLDGQRKACTVVERYEFDGTKIGEIDLGGPASAGVSANQDRTEAFISISAFERPPAIYRIDLRDSTPKLDDAAIWERVNFPVDTTKFESKQVTYASKDGTPVTMFLIHKKGLVLDGNNPTVLSGYGGFRIPTTPGFRSTSIPFIEDGGVIALPNLRGGNEYGESWHENGMLGKKQNVFDDFEYAARWLINEKYTSPQRLCIRGGSNGGLLVGAAVTQHPELYKAAVCQVPLLDMLRYHRFLMARYWVPEYGSSEVEAQFKWLKEYSPYQQIKPGTQYPAMFITAGENDTRVHPLHARKFAAMLQAVDPSTPKLLWVDRDAGHGAGKPLELILRDVVDQEMFVRWQLGM